MPKRILLTSIIKLFKIIRFKITERFLNAFNNVAAFILDINNYTVSIYICIKILNILRYKINNIQSTLKELMLIIIELKNVHKRNESRICLKY